MTRTVRSPVRVFRPEVGLRVVLAVATALGALVVISVLVDAAASTSGGVGNVGWWCFAAIGMLGVTLGVRSLFARVIADRDGLWVVGLMGRRRFSWQGIDRFEITRWRARAVLVSKDGRRHGLALLSLSGAERLLSKGSETERVVGALNALLADASTLGRQASEGDDA